MAAFNKFDAFVEHLAEGVHNLGSNQLAVALVNSPAPAVGNTVLANLTQISYTNLPTSRNVTIATSLQTAGLYRLIATTDLVLTATGAVGPFQYVVLYNDTPTTPFVDPLIGWYNYGTAVTLANGETFTVDFDGTNGILTLQ